MQYIKTLDEFIIEKQHDFPNASGDLSALLSCIQLAAKVVNSAVNKAGLLDILGENDCQNIHGERQKKLDLLANNAFKTALSARRLVCGLASEEEDHIVVFKEHQNLDAKYVVSLDPLDGSSNIDVNVSIGTIFSIYHRITPIGTPITEADFLQTGRAQVAAGYVIYGSSTMLVYTTGRGVHGFTYDPALGSFCLSHQSIRTPTEGKIYSINAGHSGHFPRSVKNYINYCQQVDSTENHPYSLRYIGSLVADFHRNLLLGGIFLYPQSLLYPEGKLRLLYECNPMAYLIEQAGGSASNGEQAILDLQPASLHQRTPLFIGSKQMVLDLLRFITEENLTHRERELS